MLCGLAPVSDAVYIICEGRISAAVSPVLQSLFYYVEST